MSLSIGIVGLPNVGKSTLFNALLRKSQALAANYPFATIEPNVGIVELPDERLGVLAKIIEKSKHVLPPEVHATVTFTDIAGLVKGASQGEGLGNQFLANIRETDAICHVLREFRDEDVIRAGAVTAIEDLSVIRTELLLADMSTLEKQREPKSNASKEDVARWQLVSKLKEKLGQGLLAHQILNEEELLLVKPLSLLTAKPELFVLNVSEEDLARAEEKAEEFAIEAELDVNQVVVICAKVESELAGLSIEEHKEYLASLGMSETGLDLLARAGYRTLGLISFLTAGEKEVRAWTLKAGLNAQLAAGVIHTDFIQKFIKAKIVAYDDFVHYGGWKEAAEVGKVRMEGRDYIMKEGDVVEFMIGS